MSDKLEEFISKLQELGGSASNPTLKQALGWKPPEFEAVKKAALKARRVKAGRGYGGRLTVAVPSTEKPNGSGKRVILVDEDGNLKGGGQLVEIVETSGTVVVVIK